MDGAMVFCDWEEHNVPGDSGRKYYFNRMTKASVWEKPTELIDSENAATRKATQAAAGQWEEHPAPNGKKYYYNTVTKQSTWTMPPEFKKEIGRIMSAKGELSELEKALAKSKQEIADLEKPSAEAIISKVESAPGSMAAVTPSPRVKRDWSTVDKEECRAAFRELLVDKGVGSTFSWDQTMKLCCTDNRYQAFKTTAEKKVILSEYQSEKSREQREEKRRLDKQRREQFHQMLEDAEVKVELGTKWLDRAVDFIGDSRCIAIADEREKVDLFDQFVRELGKKEKEAQRQQRKAHMQAADEMLVADPRVTVDTKWVDVPELVGTKEEWNRIDKLDQLIVFETVKKDMEKAEDLRKKEARRAAARAERVNRDEFKALLTEQQREGAIHARSMYGEWLVQNKENSVYKSVLTQLGSTPRNLFEDLVEEMQQEMNRHTRLIRDALKQKEFKMDSGTEFDMFENAVKEDEELASSVRGTPLKPIFDELQSQAKKEKKAAERRLRHMREDYEDLIVSKQFNLETVTWDDAKERLAKHSAYKALSGEAQGQEMFEEWLAEEKTRGTRKRECSDDEEEEGEHRSKKKKHKKDKKDKKHKNRSKSKKRSQSRSRS